MSEVSAVCPECFSARWNPKTVSCEACGYRLSDADKFDPRKATLVIYGTDKNCEHDFQGWREFGEDGGVRGGETVCTKCGMGAMAWSLRTGL